jgi:NADH-dependent peroxiredoxin subunit F
MYDVIIVGGGPAGLTAALYLIRKKIKTVILTQGVGGQAMDAPEIENYPAYQLITGGDWVSKTRDQLTKLEPEVIKEGIDVTGIVKAGEDFEVQVSGGEKFTAKAVVITSGKTPRKLGVPGEKELFGKGISVCVTCDGPLFGGKDVVVLGGGNSAICAAIELEKYANKVHVLNIGKDLIGEEVRIDQLKKSPKVEIIGNVKTTEILGEAFVSGMKYKDLTTGEEKELACQGIFEEIGWEPSTKYLEGFVELSPTKEIEIDKDNATSVPGVFAAGDVTDIAYKQLIIAAGEGAKAALSAWDYLSKKKV